MFSSLIFCSNIEQSFTVDSVVNFVELNATFIDSRNVSDLIVQGYDERLNHQKSGESTKDHASTKPKYVYHPARSIQNR